MTTQLSRQDLTGACQKRGRPAEIVQGLMLCIICAIFGRMVQGQRPTRKISVPQAIVLIEWILDWMSKNPAHYGLTLEEVQGATKPCESLLRRHFHHNAELTARLDDSTRPLAQRIEALLPVKPSCSHALWQMDGQFLTRKKATLYLKKAGYTGHQISSFVTQGGEDVKSLYVLRAIDVASSFQLGITILPYRANQLDVARFLLELFMNWGLPRELRVDLGGEHIAHGVRHIVRDLLDVGWQPKTSKSAKLNGSIEVHHRIHSVLIAQVAIQGQIPLLVNEGNKMVASIAALGVASRHASEIYANRKMASTGKSPQELLAELPSLARTHLTDDELRSMFHFDWIRCIDRRSTSLRLGELVIQHDILRYHRKVRVRFYPSYNGDRLEVRKLYSKELLLWIEL